MCTEALTLVKVLLATHRHKEFNRIIRINRVEQTNKPYRDHPSQLLLRQASFRVVFIAHLYVVRCIIVAVS